MSVGMAAFPFLKAFMHSFLGYVVQNAILVDKLLRFSVRLWFTHASIPAGGIVVNRLVVDSMSCQSSK